MADTPPNPPKNENASAPKTVQMPRTVHELITGPKPDQRIAPKTFIDDQVAEKHKLSDAAIKRLISAGAIDLVDVLKG